MLTDNCSPSNDNSRKSTNKLLGITGICNRKTTKMAGTEDVASFLREHVCDPREASYYADAFRSVGVRNLNVLRLWYRSLKDRNQLTETLGKHLDAVSIFARPALEDALIKAFGPPGKLKESLILFFFLFLCLLTRIVCRQ